MDTWCVSPCLRALYLWTVCSRLLVCHSVLKKSDARDQPAVCFMVSTLSLRFLAAEVDACQAECALWVWVLMPLWCNVPLIQFDMVFFPTGLFGAWWLMNSWFSLVWTSLVASMYASRCDATHRLDSLTSFGTDNLGSALPGFDVFIFSVMTVSNPSLTANMELYFITLSVCT